MTTIRLCGRLQVRLGGRDVTLPGRQGRALFAYLVLERERTITRDELIGLLWPAAPPADPGKTLSALLSRMRRGLGAELLGERGDLALTLPDDVWIDYEAALRDAVRAEAAVAAGDWRAALTAAGAAGVTAGGGFLAGDELPWIEDRRRDVEELRLRALESIAAAGIALGPPDLAAGERAARAIVEAAPFRESGHRLLMTALAAHGDVAEALRAYDDLRVLLRDELGTAPGAGLQALHRRLLGGEALPATELPLVQPAEERKLVTVLCAELASPLWRADPEDVRASLADAHERLRSVVERFGGMALQRVGGPALALFGVPAAHEDDAERAVRAALEACATGVARRAAVATGEAIVGGAPAEVMGEVAVTVHELLGLAPATEVSVAGATVAATREAIEYHHEGRAALARGPRPRSRSPARRARLIGRRRELAALREACRAVAEERRPRSAVVVGHAGIGKSRLVQELLDETLDGQALVLRGRCAAYGEGIAYGALREILWEVAGIALDDRAAVAAGKLAALADAYELPESTVSALAMSAGIALPDNKLAEASPASVAEEVGLAWPALLTALAARSFVLVTIEDLHWADAPLLETIERIVGRSQGALLLLATARPEFAEAHPAWSSRAGFSQIGLEPLTTAESSRLVAERLPDAGAALRDRVVALAEGNPFFAEELAHHLADGAEPEAAIPDTVRALLSARIDALPPAEKSVLQHAAVVGRRFWAPALEPNRTGRPIPDMLRSLEDRGLVVMRTSSSLPGQRELSFAHGLTREVAYRSIPRGARSRTHASVAAWLEELVGDRRDEFLDLLAHHYGAAADDAVLAWPEDPGERERIRVRAVRALLDACDEARGRCAVDAARRYADRALALAADDAERLAAVELTARACHTAVRGDEALAAYEEALGLARSLGDEAAVARLRSHAVLLCARYMGAFTREGWQPLARDLLQEGLIERGDHGMDFETGALLVGRAWGRARWGLTGDGDAPRDLEAARRDAERAVQIAEAIGSAYLLSHALEGLTWIVFEKGLCDARAMAERLLSTAEPAVDRMEAHESVVVAAICFSRAGDFDRAAVAASEATRHAPRMSAHRALHAAAAETIALAPPGRFGELLAATERVADLAEEEGARICATGMVGLAGRALALYETGDRERAARVVGALDAVAPTARALRSYGHPILELLRPVVGLAETRRRLEAVERPAGVGGRISRLRVELPLWALVGEPELLQQAVREARALAKPACAPALGWIAEWAQAARLGMAGRSADAVQAALAAATALEAHGERYTALRLLVDLRRLVGADTEIADYAAPRLAAMGAVTSAAEAGAPSLLS